MTDSRNAISVLLNTGKGKFEDWIWTPVSGGAGCGVAADFNGDGKPDLAVNNAQGVTILLGTGSARLPFSTGSTLSQANDGCLATGDVNRDGIPGLIVPTSTAVVTYLGKGNGTFTQASSVPTTAEGYIALADFNRDGKVDFATSANLLALGNGDGTFQTPKPFVTNPPVGGFSYIAVGDINNDGWPDIVLTNVNIPYLNAYVLLNNQHGGFTQVTTSFGALTTQAILVDLNGDGNLDLVLGAFSSGEASVYLGNGKGQFTFTLALLGALGDIPGFDVVADLNGDGIPDIAVLQPDTLSVYIGTGNATYSTPFYIGTGPAPGSASVEDLHHQRVGFPDIVVPDNSGGVATLINETK